MDCFIGTILPWPILFAPYGFSMCQGGTLATAQNQALYSLIGTLYGGTTTNFGLPDLRGRTMVGTDPGVTQYSQPAIKGGYDKTTLTISAANLPMHTHAANFTPVTGNQTVTLPAVNATGAISATATMNGVAGTGPATAANLTTAATNYLTGANANFGGDPVSVTGLYTPTAATKTGPTIGGISVAVNTTGYSPAIPKQNVTIQSVTGGAVAVQPGGGSAMQAPVVMSNMQPYLTLNFMIALLGLYPMRA